MKKYEKYKDSGIEWLGEIPEHWEVCKIKHLANLKSGDFISAQEIHESGEYCVLGGNGLRGYTNKFNVEGDHVLIGRQGALCGNINYGNNHFWATEHAIVCYPLNKINIFYFGELLRSMNLNQYSESAAQPGISVGKISNLFIPKTSLLEQEKIGSYLFYKTTQIDTLIEKKEQLVEKLTLKRQAIINEAVTKGLNPDVPMKDSGIEWLGEVPEHWEVIKIKNVALINPTKSELKDIIEDETLVSFLPMQKVGEDWKVNLDTNSKLSEVYTGFTYFRDGDIIVAKITPCFENGKGALLNNLKNGIGFGSTEFHVIRPQRIVPLFLSYVLRADIFMTNGESFMVGSAGQKRVPTSFIENFYIGFPSQKEQFLIAEYINNKVETIDRTVIKVHESIEKLKLYRQSLISEAVTGKIDLRDWKANRQ